MSKTPRDTEVPPSTDSNLPKPTTTVEIP
jgi:CRP-like cAMP-binding protein